MIYEYICVQMQGNTAIMCSADMKEGFFSGRNGDCWQQLWETGEKPRRFGARWALRVSVCVCVYSETLRKLIAILFLCSDSRHARACTRTHARTHAHTHAHTRTHTHTHALICTAPYTSWLCPYVLRVLVMVVTIFKTCCFLPCQNQFFFHTFVLLAFVVVLLLLFVEMYCS